MAGSLALPLAAFASCSQGAGNSSVGDAGGGDATRDVAPEGGNDAPSGSDGPSGADAPSGTDAPSEAATGDDAGDSGAENAGDAGDAGDAEDAGDAGAAGDADAGCAASDSLCGTACIDEQTDPANCGACGHSCGGGTCSAGTCQPWAIAGGRTAPLNMAIDANNVYWTENTTGGVYQVAKNGGTVFTIKPADGTASSSWAVTTDSNGGGTYVFWTDRANNRVGVGPIGGGAIWYFNSPKGSNAGTYGIAQDFTGGVDYVYVSDFTQSDIWYFAASSNMTGGTGTQASFFSALNPTGLFEYPGGGLLVTLWNAGTVVNGGNGPIASGKNDDSRYVTSDGATAYWTASDGNQVWAAPVSGSSSNPPTLVSGSESQPWGIASDGPGSVYWVNKTSGTIAHGSLSAGAWTVTVVATGNAPTDVRVDSTAVYWTDTGSGQIMRVNK